MALSKRSASYSFAIRSIVDYFEMDEEAQEVVHTFEDIKQAQHYRFLFYGYRKALRLEDNPLADTAEKVLVQIPTDWKENSVARVVFSLRDNQLADKNLEATIMQAMEKTRERMRLTQGDEVTARTTGAASTPHEHTHDEVLAEFLAEKR